MNQGNDMGPGPSSASNESLVRYLLLTVLLPIWALALGRWCGFIVMDL